VVKEKDRQVAIEIQRRAELSSEQAIIASFSSNQAGNAQAAKYVFNGNVLHNTSLGWLVWNGQMWERSRERVKLLVVGVLEARYDVALQARDKELQYTSRADNANVNGTMDLLAAYVDIPLEFFDSNNDILPAPNGLIDLATGRLLPHDSTQGFTFNTTVEYDEQASYERWVEFLHTSVGGGDEAIEALQMYAGYMLTGRTDDEKMLYLYGETRAGKGTFTETLASLVPSPISQARSFATFTANRDSDTNNFDMASLRTARMLFASESERRHSLNAPFVKSMTGGDLLYAAFKGKDGFNFRPRFKTVLSSNYEVNADAYDSAVWGRLVVVNFPHSFLDREDNLKAVFRQPEMLQGVLKWAVEGAMKWYKAGRLLVPQSVKDNAIAARARLDRVSDWLLEEAIMDDSSFVSFSDLVRSYEAWCRNNAVEPKKSNALADALKVKGLKDTKKYITDDSGTRKQVRGYIGLELIEE